MSLAQIEEAATDEEKLKTLKEITKDVNLLQEYFDDPEAVVENIWKLSSEVARLEAIKQLLKKMTETKNDFVKAFFKMSEVVEETTRQYNEVRKERKEILKEIETTRLISKGLMMQLKAVSEIMESGKFNKKLIKEIFSETKQILFICPKCNKEIFGTGIESLRDNPECKKCHEPYEINLIYSPD